MNNPLHPGKSAGPSRPKQDRAGCDHLIAMAIAALAMFFAASPAQIQAGAGHD